MAWKMGWPEYIYIPERDDYSVVEIAETCAKIAGVDLDTEEGFRRITTGLASIAAWCRDSKRWGSQNMQYIRASLQNVLLEMNADRIAREKALAAQTESTRIYEGAKQRAYEDEKKMIYESMKSAEWCLDNWDNFWEWSEMRSKETRRAINMTHKEAIEDLKDKSKDLILEIEQRVVAFKRRTRERYLELKQQYENYGS